MAATPPLQITGTPLTPPTPLHGATYDHRDSPRRTSARLRHKRVSGEVAFQSSDKPTRSVQTPNTPRMSNFDPHSPDQTPQRNSTSRRVQVMSPTSPETDTLPPPSKRSRTGNSGQSFSVNTIMGEGMLPTPVKTPSKRHKTINKSNIAARALFQDQLADEEMAPSPRRNRKSKRFNGFSLESFRTEDGLTANGVQIFTDSRDQIPELDNHDDNPFIDHDSRGSSKRAAGSSKRRKISKSKKIDPQVEQALLDDEGMVYVFRGKKVYRRFDDGGEEEEEIDAEDLGLLEHAVDGQQIVKPLKTLTRKSIRPIRLFQTEAQKRAREIEREEEASTDVDDPLTKPFDNDLEAQGDQHAPVRIIKAAKGKAKVSQGAFASPSAESEVNGKKAKFFDSWPRIKPGSGSSISTPKATRGRKRTASESVEEPITTSR